MKKLMIAASAALCATVSFAELASANVVGYASNELRSGSIGLVSQFVSTSGGAVDLQDIKCNDAASDSVSFMILDNIGLGGESFNWVDWYENENGETEACWVDSDFAKVVGMKIQPGQGMWVAADNDEQYITFPGVEL